MTADSKMAGTALALAASLVVTGLAGGCGGGGGGTDDGGDTDGGGSDSGSIDGGGSDSGSVDAGGSDGGAIDAAADATAGDAATDAALPMCSPTAAECRDGTSCECCPVGGPAQACLCSTTCTSNDDCTDPARPTCNQPGAGSEGFCTPSGFHCCWECD